MTKTVSVRIPASLAAAARADAENAEMSFSELLNLLLECSFDGSEILCALEDFPGLLDFKLDVRITYQTVNSLKSVCQRLGLPLGVYVRKLLYHFYVTKKVSVVGKVGHYKLAGDRDKR